MIPVMKRLHLAMLFSILAMVLAVEATAAAQDEGLEDPPSDTDARDQEARALYQAGRVAFDDGRFEEALGYFERSHQLSGRPELLFNIGSAADRLRRNEYALESLEAYLAALPDATNRRSVEARIAVLRQAAAASSATMTPEGTAARGNDAAASLPEQQAPSRTGLWVGLGVGAAVLVGLAVVLGIVLRSDDPDYRESEQGLLVFTLGGTP